MNTYLPSWEVLSEPSKFSILACMGRGRTQVASGAFRRDANREELPEPLPKTETSREMWHVSLPAARTSIAEHGLDNTVACDEHIVWSNADDWDEGIYLWDSYESACAYAWDLADMGYEPDVYRIDAAGLKLLPDITGVTPVVGAWWAIRVAPECLQLVEQIFAPTEEDEPQIGPPRVLSTQKASS